jgi:hypothetical protein
MKFWIARIGWPPGDRKICRRYDGKSEPGQCRAEALRCDPLAPSRHTHDQGHDKQNEEDKEQDLGDASRRRSDAAKTKDSRDDRDNKEDKRPTEHDVLRRMNLK